MCFDDDALTLNYADRVNSSLYYMTQNYLELANRHIFHLRVKYQKKY